MKFLSIELAGYIRISLSNINYIKINFEQDIQLILGTNGSGKSSLLNELTPMPSNPNDYLKEGFSVKTIIHNGYLYVLKSTFNPSQKHSFVKDGEELNPSGTVSIQKELVKQNFGITQEIKDLALGRDKFTTMSPSQRRYWLTQLAPVSYEYSIGVYNKLKERLRDVSGAIKLNTARLVSENSSLLPTEQVNTLKQEVEELHLFLQHITEYRKPLENISDISEIEQLIEIGKRNSIELIRKISAIKKQDYRVKAEVISLTIQELVSQRNALIIIQEDLNKRISRLSENLEILKKTGQNGVEELQSKITSLNLRKTDLLITRKLITFSPNEKSSEAFRAINHVYDGLVSILQEIPPNSDLRYSNSIRVECQNKLSEVIVNIEKIKNLISNLQARKDHQDKHKEDKSVVCPKCSAGFSLVFNLKEYNSIAEQLEKLNTDLQNKLKEKEELEIQLQDIASYISFYNSYRVIKNTNPSLDFLWEFLDKEIIIDPRACIFSIDKIRSDLLTNVKCLELDKEASDIMKLLDARKSLEEQDVEKIERSFEQINTEIYDLQVKIKKLNLRINQLQDYDKRLNEIFDLQQKLSDVLNKAQDLTNQKIENNRRQTVIDGIKFVQSVLASKEKMLFDVKNQQSIINSLENQIADLKTQEQCLKILVQELSPIEGLIAEGLFGFINMFLSQMNAFIKKVWTYKMKILSCQLENDNAVELDYKFPIAVEDREKPVPDISMGSTGMKEIIDLAFKITAIKHLGLQDMPLFLDEFGSTFDHTHRNQVYGIFDYLVNQINFSQVFLVNHYSDLYGSLKNAEICVLHEDNIQVPQGSVFNKHVIIA